LQPILYRLPQVLRDHPELKSVGRLTLRQSFGCIRWSCGMSPEALIRSAKCAGVISNPDAPSVLTGPPRSRSSNQNAHMASRFNRSRSDAWLSRPLLGHDGARRFRSFSRKARSSASIRAPSDEAGILQGFDANRLRS
jgi:hypothetical protein